MANSLPSTILKSMFRIRPRELKYVYENTAWQVKDFLLNKGRATFTQDEKSVLDMVVDTVGMAEQVGEEVNFNWSVRRMKEEHDRLTKVVEMQGVDYDNFNLDIYLPRRMEFHGVIAELIETPERLLQEGIDMGHYVFSYANAIKNGRYIVYSLKDDSGYRTTLGFAIGVAGAVIDQHYGKYNSVVNDSTYLTVAEDLRKEVQSAVTVASISKGDINIEDANLPLPFGMNMGPFPF